MTGTDAEVVARVLAGARDEYSVLVSRYQDSLYRYAVGMVGSGDDAADIVQDSFVRGFTRLDRCQDPDRFGAWVYRIVRNQCLDYLKNRRRRDITLEDDAPFTSGDDPALYMDRLEVHRLVGSALAELPIAQREAFLMKHVDDLAYEEIAVITGASVSALKMRVKRARETLQSLLSAREGVGL
jgi:RNA polymerase sigma-70 factor (ECF subfamily)